MDAGVAAIVAASISTIVGGTLGFLSSYFTTRQASDQVRVAVALPKQLEAAEYVAMILFRLSSGESISREEWNRYIASAFWLPGRLRLSCLAVLSDSADDSSTRDANESILEFFDGLTIGGSK